MNLIYKIWEYLTGSKKMHIDESLRRIFENQECLLKQNSEIITRMRLIKRFMFIKEIAPSLIESFKTELFEMSPGILSDIQTTWSRRDDDIKKIVLDFVSETEAMVSPLTTYETDISSQVQRRIFSDLIQKETRHTPNCYNSWVESLMAHGEIGEELREVFVSIEQIPNAWKVIPNKLWLRYIAFCLLDNQVEKAREILDKYTSVHKTKALASMLPVAHFAYSMGHRSQEMELSAELFDEMRQNADNQVFEKFITGKTVALIGNGPQEMGKGSGKDIDAHDIVIRFNGYTNTDAFAKDYGRKANCVAMNIHYATRDLSDNEIKLFVFGENIYYFFLDQKRIANLYQQKKKRGRYVLCYPLTLRSRIEELTKLKMPSLGIRLIYWLLRGQALFSYDDCYGFSFKEKEVIPKKMNHYFKLDQAGYLIENLAKEKDAVLKLFSLKAHQLQ